jgi:hypothetical protein
MAFLLLSSPVYGYVLDRKGDDVTLCMLSLDCCDDVTLCMMM